MTIHLTFASTQGPAAPASFESQNFVNAPTAGTNSLFLSRIDGTTGHAVLEYNLASGWRAYGDLSTIAAYYDGSPSSSGLPILDSASGNVLMSYSSTSSDVKEVWDLTNTVVASSPFTETVIAALPDFNQWLVFSVDEAMFYIQHASGVVDKSIALASGIIGDSATLVAQLVINGIQYVLVSGANEDNGQSNEVTPFAVISYDGTSLVNVFDSAEYMSIAAPLYNFDGVPMVLGENPNTYEQYVITAKGATEFDGEIGDRFVTPFASAGNLLIGNYFSATTYTYVLCGIPSLDALYTQKPETTRPYGPPTLYTPNGWVSFERNDSGVAFPLTASFGLSNPVTHVVAVRNYCHNFSRGVPVNFGGNLTLPETYNARLKS